MKIACFVILSLLPVAFSQDSLEDNTRVKRAGFSLLNGALSNIQKSAFSASASLSSGSSGSSSGGHSQDNDVHTHTYSHNVASSATDFEEPHHDSKSFDGGELKKSIINTLLQAVKAIAGGVVSLKGQLIKGSGYLVSSGGKLIATGGDAVSDAGHNIISSAHLVKPESGGGYGTSGGYGSSDHGSNSIGHSLGGAFSGFSSGIAKSISGLSAGSAGSISKLSASSSSSSSNQVAHLSGSSSTSSANQAGQLSSGSSKQIGQLSSGSSSQIAHLSSGSSASSSGSSSGHSSGGDSGSHAQQGHGQQSHGHGQQGHGQQSHGQSYASQEGPSYSYNIPESNYDGGYDVKPAVVLNSYGPPKGHHHHEAAPEVSYVEEPHSSYGAPSYNDGFSSSSSQEANDVLAQILKDLPYKPMKTVGQYSDQQSFNHLPLSDNRVPPFKPLSDYPTYHPQNILPEYGPPNHFSDFSGEASAVKPLAVNPKAYDIYHSMKVKMSKENYVTLPSILDNIHGLEIQKSIAYEFKA